MKNLLSWQDIETACFNIAQKAIPYEPDCIVAVSRGGYIPARLVAEHLNIKHIYSVGLSSYNEENIQADVSEYQSPIKDIIINNHKLAIIVDEIADSGSTFKYLSNTWKTQKYISCIFAAMYVKARCEMVPSIYYKKINNDDWLVFPWEKN
jgi:hypoxanthine phosphoribosyltransferase